MMDKCPVCGADTRQGDNYCLNCGQRLLPLTPSPPPMQAAAGIGEATVAGPEEWSNAGSSSGSMWASDTNAQTIAADQPTLRGDQASATAQATLDRIEEPGHFVLRSDTGDVLQEYPLDKFEIVIGRAPTSDILLSKDKLTSRRHAVVNYENGRYLLHDERSANGTFVNGQQIEEVVPIELKDGDHVGIGEHELVFHAHDSIADPPTIAVPFEGAPSYMTASTQQDPLATIPPTDDFYTRPAAEEEAIAAPAASAQEPTRYEAAPEPESQPEPAPEPEAAPALNPTVIARAPYVAPVEPEPAVLAPAQPQVAAVAQPVQTVANTSAPAQRNDTGVTFARLSNLSQPALPDMSALMAALSALDGQIMSLQEQFNATQESMRNHDAEVAQTSNQLRTGIRRVAERMDNTIADVARSREALAWAELLQLMEDVMNNPRDIEYVTKLARKARELNKVFQIHQNVLNTMAECNSLLRSMIGEEH